MATQTSTSRRRQLGPIAAALLLICGVIWLGGKTGVVLKSFQEVSPPTTNARAEDIDFLVRELPHLHKNLFFRLTPEEFATRAAGLKEALPAMTGDGFFIGLSRLVAAVGDSHTAVGWQPQRAFPLMLYWFKEGICVLNASKGNERMLYGKLVSVDGRPIEDVISAFAEVIPHENEMQLRQIIPQRLAATEYLSGLKIIRNADSAIFQVVTRQGERVACLLRSQPVRSPVDWIVNLSLTSGWPLYLRNRDKFFWHEYLKDAGTVYFKYNSCQNMANRPFPEFSRELLALIATEPVERLIIDLRNNGGGNSMILMPFVSELAKVEKINRTGRLFVVLGRQTFSSAILNAIALRKQTRAIFVGEPTGGKPNHYGEVKTLRLPNTKITVTYSTKFFQHADEDTPSLLPDHVIELSIEDYVAGRDPVLEEILSDRWGRRRQKIGRGNLIPQAILCYKKALGTIPKDKRQTGNFWNNSRRARGRDDSSVLSRLFEDENINAPVLGPPVTRLVVSDRLGTAEAEHLHPVKRNPVFLIEIFHHRLGPLLA